VLNILIINVLCLAVDYIVKMRFNFELSQIFGLHFFLSPQFNPIQPITYMFMHGGIWHLFFNMFAVYMFGQIFENLWGGWKFLLYYFVAGIGAAVVQEVIWFIDYQSVISHLNVAEIQQVKAEGLKHILNSENYINEYLGRLNILFNVPTVGASGAVFGILLAFGWMFPNEKLFFMFVPVPVSARIAVIIYGVLELFMGVVNFKGDNVAHFAHLGGLLFGMCLILWWKRQGLLFNKDLVNKHRNKKKKLKIRSVNSDYHYVKSDVEYNIEKKQNNEKMDAILDKIRTSGYSSLTDEEKRQLFELSDKIK
jgi:membrane associated rhomboid family serine protease